MTPSPTFRQLLSRPRVPIGTFCTLGSIEAIETVCHAGFDFVVVDGQHGAFSVDAMCHAIRAIDAAGVCAAARLPANGWAYVEPLLDAGYSTLIAPMINTADAARAFVRAASFPPLGLRSQASCRASLRGGPEYYDQANKHLTLLPMIEHIDAVGQCGAILAEPGISGCLIGPADLKSSLRGTGEIDSRQMDQAIAEVASVARRMDKWVGIAAGSIELAKRVAGSLHYVVHATDRGFLHDSLARAMHEWTSREACG